MAAPAPIPFTTYQAGAPLPSRVPVIHTNRPDGVHCVVGKVFMALSVPAAIGSMALPNLVPNIFGMSREAVMGIGLLGSVALFAVGFFTTLNEDCCNAYGRDEELGIIV